jgi:hypothetical protein
MPDAPLPASGVQRRLYLHEVIDIVGEGSVPYMEQSVLGFKTDTAADRGLELFGTWSVMGSTGRWPQVVNVWELPDGWESWRRLCESTNLKRESNEELRQWWREAYERRSGGRDRLLGAAPGCPSLDQLVAEQVSGTMFVHEQSRVLSGGALDYLEAVEHQRAPVLAEHGHVLVGLWENVFDDTEVCVIWATNLDAHVALGAATDAARGVSTVPPVDIDERLSIWIERRRALTTHCHEELMIPCPGTPLGPAAWAT